MGMYDESEDHFVDTNKKVNPSDAIHPYPCTCAPSCGCMDERSEA